MWTGARATRAFVYVACPSLSKITRSSRGNHWTVRMCCGVADRAATLLLTKPASEMSKRKIYVLSRIPNLGHQLTDALKDNASVVEITAKFTIHDDEPTIKPEVVQRLQSAEILITDTHILKDILYKLPNMKWVQLTSAGVDNLLPHLDRRKPPPTYTIARASCFGILMAEYVVAGIINIERGLYSYYDLQKKKEWFDQASLQFRTLSDLTVGILGAGVIGQEIASTLKRFGTAVHGLARRRRSLEELTRSSFEMIHSELSELLKYSDYIVNALPSTPNTTGMLNGEVLKNCRKKPVLINIGRGTIISEESIIEALNNGWISGAILDVFATEPLPVDSPLWSQPNVIITPHMSGPSRPHEIVKSFMQNFENFTRGDPLFHTFSFTADY
uniref:Putative glyoxylate/hydroxypyruvate reduct n=1 Tax=Ixodes ricinus TaxID=34613 RepID=A0A131XYI2_IXORI